MLIKASFLTPTGKLYKDDEVFLTNLNGKTYSKVEKYKPTSSSFYHRI